MNVLEQILQHKIVAIIRGAKPADVVKIVNALYEGGIRLVEITLNSEDALNVIKTVSQAFSNKMLVGAGTVLDAQSAIAATDAGAQFIISPSFDVETIQTTLKHGAISIPGAYTATEIVAAHKAGAHIVKVFPTSSAQYIKDLRGPLSHIPMMPTGGVNLDNIVEFKNAGAVAYGIGSSLVDGKQIVTDAFVEQLVYKGKLFVQAINNPS